MVVAALGIYHVGGVREVWDRGVAGGRIIPFKCVSSLYRAFSAVKIFSIQFLVIVSHSI